MEGASNDQKLAAIITPPVKVIEILEFDGTYIVEINKKKLTFSEKICQNLLLETYD